jgi:hypothetical protein
MVPGRGGTAGWFADFAPVRRAPEALQYGLISEIVTRT